MSDKIRAGLPAIVSDENGVVILGSVADWKFLPSPT